MRNIIFVLAIAIIFTSCGDSNRQKSLEGKEVLSTYTNGAPQIERDFIMIDGKRLAVYEREYYEDGSLLKEGSLDVNEKRDGNWKSYYRDGKLWSEGDYANGIREGKTITYFANGNKRYEGQFLKGQKSGRWKFWNENGEVENEMIFEDGKRAEIKIDK